MSTIAKLSKLFQTISADNLNQAKIYADEIIADEEKIGHHAAAKLLRGSLRPNGRKSESFHGKNLIYEQVDVISGALSPITECIKMSDIMLKLQWQKEISIILKEWMNRDYLAKMGIQHRSKLFFYGPPGCGKSMAACAIGHELSLPTYIVRFDAIIGAYLGQTAIHLRELFRFAEMSPCILLFDEIDALGKKRGNPLDVGELDRIVIALMQELEHCHAKGIIIATSNLPKHLDNALWRRFDVAIEFPKPNKNEIIRYSRKMAQKHNIVLSHKIRKKLSNINSYADAENVIKSEARYLALEKIRD
ncbi:MAG: ATP-binding protein [Planctomycetaceae bacterium]|nr:ATP-binding protein [Planctomycetaceae bacterium]